MAKGSKVKSRKGHSKAKSTRRAQNAFEIASAQERAKHGDLDSDDDDGAIVNPTRGSDDEGEDQEFEDEELDSDEALGSDDDFDVLSSKFSQTLRDKAKSKKKSGTKHQSDGQEEEEEEEGYNSIDESELVPLSAVWDLDEKDRKKSSGKDIVLNDDWETESSQESEDDSESEEDDDDEEEFPFEQGESDEDEVELTQLKKQLQKGDKRGKKQYQDLNIEENELALPGGGDAITLTDMISIVDKDASKNAILIDKEETETSGKSLDVPLPKRIQQRHERKAAYQISKDEVNKWKDTVKQNRNAEVLSFPLNPKVQHNEASSFASTPAMTDMEKKINGLLTESALLNENQEATFEEIQTAKMSPEEVRKRTAELRKMRELMFRQEREAKRLKKIKSKSFRRIKKKEMLKNKEMIDGSSDDEDHDAKRAEERMSLKHKNNAYAKSLVRSGLSKDGEAREEMEEMLRRGERLKAKILDREDEDEEFGDMNNLDLDKEVDESSDSELRDKLGKTGVMNMAFMKNAEARERTANAEERARLQKLNATGDLEQFQEDEVNSVNISINPGRRVYTPGAGVSKAEISRVNKQVVEEEAIDSSKSLPNRLVKAHEGKSKKVSPESEQEGDDDDEIPWMAKDDKQVQKSRKVKVIDSNSSKLEKSGNKISKQQKKRKANEMDADDEILEMDGVMKLVDPHGEDSGKEEEDESQVRMFKQTDMMKQAFAGDEDVIAEFNAEKRKIVEDEGDQVEDLTLPGWGDWVGGNHKTKKNKVLKKKKGIVDANNRKDRFKQNVIINEKVNKKNAKYQAQNVPFTFETKDQYERSLRMPIGQEWTSRETHQRLTMPKITTKRGVVIDPLKAPFK
ncbi:Utp14p [Cyberlindnera jadinii NRRL Y-1542]|uniref:Small-subunit processome n=1 Tax=Cyberlindnera jadinii (strain ATCC 18201 / CBS 1600 / BCRC 20928 / JCM 3617 / NBRC 0987 / NRRL Y-1542) TaxID=983966 RepID=A0A1E4RYV6_CYBJN|nr:small-subunit processome [Cyberlindnera jadinii NRRL Y-1542]ODV72454.1 small-subunit processome [Cyberlindnera jadinii NRRL Y-1542]